jgi:hypothetical protein
VCVVVLVYVHYVLPSGVVLCNIRMYSLTRVLKVRLVICSIFLGSICTFQLLGLHNRITAAVALVNRHMLTRVWDEMDYRIDVCCISIGGHIEHL